MNGSWLIPLAIGLAYLLGSVPTGLWLGRYFRGVDIRTQGSKNIGATNTLRVLGKPLGIVALIGDMAKGLVAVLLLARLGDWTHLPLACGIAAILGHTFSVFLRFRGGKGVATSAGVFLGLATYPTALAALVFGVVFGLSHMVSAGSIAAALTLGLTVFLFPLSWPVRIAAVVVVLLVILKHRSNIRRILRKEEHRF